MAGDVREERERSSGMRYFREGKFYLVRRMKECSVEGREDIYNTIAMKQEGSCSVNACEVDRNVSEPLKEQ